MVVEPDVLVRLVISDYLRSCGYKVIEGVTAEDVFAVLRSGEPIAVVLTEIRLPGPMDGFTLANRLRESHPAIDVLLCAGVANTADKAGDLCDDGPLEKPYHPQEVIRRIGRLRERRRTSGTA